MDIRVRVVYLYRRPLVDNFSIEKVFDTVRKNLSRNIDAVVFYPRFIGKGLFCRLYNIFEASFSQADVNHITGDVHYLALFLRKKKTVLTIHDCGFLYRDHSLLERFFLVWFWYILPIAKSRVVTTVSQKTKEDILSFVKCDSAKIRVIPNPVAGGFKRVPKEFNKKSPVLLQIGTAPNKNLENLFKAISGLKCRLWIAGHLTEAQKSVLKKLKIDYKNFVDLSEKEVIDCYNKCDIVTFVSKSEGFGLPIIEANVVGRPVITSNISPMLETASNAAVFADHKKPNDIRRGIERIIGDNRYREKLILAGYENAKRFSPVSVAKQYEDLYKEIIAH